VIILLVVINIIILMAIASYYIKGYCWIFCEWMLVVINGYCISGHWWILVVINVIILMAINGYFVGGY
jgi:hypothetical protein